MRLVRASAFFAATGAAVACGAGSQGGYGSWTASDEDAGTASDAAASTGCTPGSNAECSCAGGGTGTQVCDANGIFGTCACGTLTAPDSGPAGPAVCGDRICASTESCTTCSADCGECPKCDLAPSCSNGLALPSQPKSLPFEALSAPMTTADGGAPKASATCGDAQLRLRISRIEVGHQGKEVWLPTGTISGPAQSYYCIVQASDGLTVSGSGSDASTNGTMEVALTTPTAQIPDYGGADFAPSDSLFWGQSGPRLTQGNLTVTYSCYQQKDSGSATWAAVLQAAAGAAGGLANSGPYGWAFGIGSVGLSVAAAAASAAANQGDWHIFDVTQTIDKSWFLELSNGHTFSFTQSGGDSAFHYPWSVTVYVESWGCANAIPAAP